MGKWSVEELMRDAFNASAQMVNLMKSMTVMEMTKGDFSSYFLNEGRIPLRISLQGLLDVCGLSPKAEVELIARLPNQDIQLEGSRLQRKTG